MTPRPRTPWVHIRTTNPIESVFSTVRLRHDNTKGNGSRSACLTMVFKPMETASKGWRSLNGKPLLAEVVKGTVFIDGIIESVFSTVRLRHDKTKGNGSRSACLTMVFKLMETASKGWRSLNGKPLLAEVVKGTVFIDGIKEKPAA